MKLSFTKYLLFGLGILGITSSVRAQELNKALENDKSVIKKMLPNGLTYYIKKNVEPKNRAVLYMVEKVGSSSENDQQQGLAHFLEHMAFNGTKSFPKNQLIDYLQKAGVKFGADLNAYTKFDETVYQLPVPTDTVAVFQKSFKILSEWAGGMLLDNKEIDSERGVIIEEDRQRGKNAQERMLKKMIPVFFYKSRYAERLPIGKVDILQNFKYETLKDFYKTWYRPNLQAVVAVGDFDVKAVEKLIIQNFSGLKNPAKPKPVQKYNLVPNEKPLVTVLTDSEQPYNVGIIYFKQFNQKPTRTVGDMKKDMITSMLNTVLRNRIKDLMDAGKAPFVFASSNYGPFQDAIDPSVYAMENIVVSKDATGLTAAITGLMKEVYRLVQFGATASELEIIKKDFVESNESSYKERNKVPSASWVQQYVDNFLKNDLYLSSEDSYQLNKSLVQNITLNDVNAVAKTLISGKNETILIQAPESQKAQLPTEAALLQAVNDGAVGLSAYEDVKIDKPLLDPLPTPGTVTQQTEDKNTEITTLKLSNGVTVYLKPTSFKNDEILISAFQKGGNSKFDNFIATRDVNSIISSGIGEFSQADLRKLLAGKLANVSPYINDLYQGFSGSSTPKDLEVAFQQLYAYATNPRKDQAVFNKNIDEQKVVLQNKYANPLGVYQDSIGIFMANHNPRFMPEQLSDLEKVSLDASYEVYKKAFSNANGMEFVIVGNFKMDEIKPLIEKYIASLPSQTSEMPAYIDRNETPPAGAHTVKVYKGIEDKSYVYIIMQDEIAYSRKNSLLLSAINEGLENKIMERLREKEGGVYSPGVSVNLSAEPKGRYTIAINFNCASENVDKLIKASFEEINKIKDNGISKDDFEKFKSETARSYEVNINKNNYWLSSIGSRVKNKEPFSMILSYKEDLQKITMDEVNAAAKKYLNTPNMYQFILLPESAKK